MPYDSNDPYAPLNPLLPQVQLYPGARPGFGLQDAHEMAVNRATGRQTATPRAGYGGAESPLGASINSAKKMAAMTLTGANLSPEEQSQVEQLVNDPSVSPSTFESVTRMLRQRTYNQERQQAKQPVTHQFETADNPSPTGSISISRGTDANAMSEADFAAGQERVAANLTPGETMVSNSPGSYMVSGGALNPADNQVKSDPIVDLYNSVKDELTPEQQAQWKATAQAGANVVHLTTLTHQMTKGDKEESFNRKNEQTRYLIAELDKQMEALRDAGSLKGALPWNATRPGFDQYQALQKQRDALFQDVQQGSNILQQLRAKQQPQYNPNITHEGAQRFVKTAVNPKTGERLGLTPEGQWVRI